MQITAAQQPQSMEIGKIMNESELIQAIETNPFDETCRRRYAEWLEAKGDERGEFLLIQMRLA